MKRVFVRILFLLLIPVICLSMAAYYYFTGGRYVVTRNAYVKAHLVNISSDLDGRVIAVKVKNNQRVRQGDLLFRIDSKPAEIELTSARAETSNVRQRIDSLKSRYRQALLEIDDAREQIRYLESRLQRQQKLKQQGLGTESDYDSAKHELEMGRRALASANQRSVIALADLGGDPKMPAEKHALFLSAQSKVDRALHDLDATRVTAPADGILSNVALQAGEYVESGAPVFSIVGTGELWVEANFKESQLTHLRAGQKATIVVDAFPDIVLSATVSSLSPATGAEFAVLPPQNATGNWVKVVQRIPVRLDLDEPLAGPSLRAGMTSTVSIDTGHQRQIPVIFQSVLASISANR